MEDEERFGTEEQEGATSRELNPTRESASDPQSEANSPEASSDQNSRIPKCADEIGFRHVTLSAPQETRSKGKDIEVTAGERQHDMDDEEIEEQGEVPDIHAVALAIAVPVVGPEVVRYEDYGNEIGKLIQSSSIVASAAKHWMKFSQFRRKPGVSPRLEELMDESNLSREEQAHDMLNRVKMHQLTRTKHGF